MAEGKHTPGPWAVRPGFGEGTLEIYPHTEGARPPFGEWASIAVVEDNWGEDTDAGPHEQEDTAPNAYLMAASPDLAAALNRLYSAYLGLLEKGHERILALGGTCDPVEVMINGDPALRAAREALAKSKVPAHG